MSKWMTPKFRVGFAPPSPPIDPPLMNPIELLFAEVKQYLQANSALLDTTLTIPAILFISKSCVTFATYGNHSSVKT